MGKGRKLGREGGRVGGREGTGVPGSSTSHHPVPTNQLSKQQTAQEMSSHVRGQWQKARAGRHVTQAQACAFAGEGKGRWGKVGQGKVGKGVKGRWGWGKGVGGTW